MGLERVNSISRIDVHSIPTELEFLDDKEEVIVKYGVGRYT